MQDHVVGIGHIGLAVEDLDRSVAFYTEMVGLKLTERFDYPNDEVGHGVAVFAGAFIRSGAPHHCISLFAMRNAEQPTGHVFGLHHLAFEVRTAGALLELYRRFKQEGVTLVAARRGGPGNQPRFYARDPDGNLLEFFWSIDQIGWDGVPREYLPIEDIDLESFDFATFASERERAAARERRARMSEGEVIAGS